MPVALLLQDVVEQRGLAGTQEAGDLRGSGGRAEVQHARRGGWAQEAVAARAALESDLWGPQGVRAGRRGAAAGRSEEVRRAVRCGASPASLESSRSQASAWCSLQPLPSAVQAAEVAKRASTRRLSRLWPACALF